MLIIIGNEDSYIVKPSSPIEQAIKKMLKADLGVMPVAEVPDKLVGIVTRKDLLKAYI